MQRNNNGAKNKALKIYKSKHNWEAFDALPRDIKETLWYSTLPIGVFGTNITPATCNAFRQQLADAKRMQSQSTRATYGADHPQAGITLADLGL